MRRIHLIGLVFIGAATGLAAHFGCSNRTTPDASSSDREVELCTESCTGWRASCGEPALDTDGLDECIGDCLTRYFRGRAEPCGVVGARVLEACNLAANGECPTETPETCLRAKYVFSACIPDPEAWAANDCDDKCPGECCAPYEDH